ncbi:MAG: DNA polymerase IV [Rhodospirillales bacterium]|nr:MAG: DNA polymerase IV [Rhodospirillales bacterium]
MEPPAVRKIIHVDMDAFFASVEQRDDPSLRGRPVAVGGSRERGVVAAASYEARKFGVRSAMPSVKARRLCAELVFVKPRFAVYKEISQQIRAIFAEYTPLVEPLSLDEAYLDVTANLKGISTATAVASEIRARIAERTGLTASAGISYNKFLAKLASDHRKPNGQYVITPAMGLDFVAALPVGKFHGVGPVTAAKMNALGIFTGADLREKPLEFLRGKFGKSGAHYHAIARAEDQRAVVPDRPRKSVGAETTFFQDLARPEAVEAALTPLFENVWSYCERTGIHGRTLTVKVRYADFQQLTRSRTAPAPFADKEAASRCVVELVRDVFPLGQPVRLLGVALSNLGPAAAEDPPQLALALA